ncbi:hypothetical protein NX02_04155 [Sphingomonas sanxanigenens DSM 19645 = NX02]|uniref:Uncharacterized protein n=1 Tax=Sphingomonas sanxanigenens DSM 19645 = NX02 TaxID=1123269 RepID=W0A6A1_9SPHN|nr:hypothetical protein NX02_04155 [Sphingomonas sanxanigenens DSM 19645 = NX02]
MLPATAAIALAPSRSSATTPIGAMLAAIRSIAPDAAARFSSAAGATWAA